MSKTSAALLIAGLLMTSAAQAQQDYPNRPVTVVNPYQAGGTTDALTRALAAGLSTRLGQQFVVVNRPGAGGAIGSASVARAEPDGYNILFAPALVVSVMPQAKPMSEVGYEPKQLVPVCQTFANTMGLVVRGDSPFKSVNDLVKAAREKPDGLNYGHQGVSTIPHLAMEEFLEAANVKINAVPYRGEPAVITDLLGGRIDVGSVVLGAVGLMGQDLRLIGVFSEERHPTFPNVPTVPEQGFNVTPTSFGGLFVTTGTPEPIIAKLSKACTEAVKDEAYVVSAERAAQPKTYFADRATFAARLQRDSEVKLRLLTKLGQIAKN